MTATLPHFAPLDVNTSFFYWKAAISALVLALALGDLWTRTIPRSIVVAAAIAGLLYHLVITLTSSHATTGIHWYPLFSALAAGLLGLFAGMFLLSLGALGGGDAKLISALGFILGWDLWLRAMTVAILCGGVLALLRALFSGRLLELVRNIGELLIWLPRERRAHPQLNTQNAGVIRSPFAVALAGGVLWALWLG